MPGVVTDTTDVHRTSQHSPVSLRTQLRHERSTLLLFRVDRPFPLSRVPRSHVAVVSPDTRSVVVSLSPRSLTQGRAGEEETLKG